MTRVSTPVAVPPGGDRRVPRTRPARDLSELPGRSGIPAGLTNLVGWATRGEDHLRRQRERHGPVYRHMFGVDPIVCVADPAAVARMARNRDGIWSAASAWGFYLSGMDPRIQGWDGILTLDGPPHRDVRRLLSPELVGHGTAAGCRELVRRAVAGWVASGRTSFAADVRRLLADMTALTFLGIRDPRRARELDRAIANLWRASFTPALGPAGVLVRRPLLGTYRTLHDALMARLRDGVDGPDLFSRFRAARGTFDWADDDTLVRTFVSTMLAAFDTTANSAASMAHLLASAPDWQARIRAEVCDDAAPGEDALQTVGMVWRESMRLYPVASHVMRRNVVECEVAGRPIPRDSLVFGLLGSGLRDPSSWPEPDRFDPERFAPDRRQQGARVRGGAMPGFMPFGVGPHACVGGQLAERQVRTVFATLLRSAEIAHPSRPAAVRAPRHVYAPLGRVAGPVRLAVSPA